MQNANHLIAQFIRAYCKDIEPALPDKFTEIPGKAVWRSSEPTPITPETQS